MSETPVAESAVHQTPGPETPELLLVTGLSGAGKSTATATLEDLGWFVVDNLPPRLLPDLMTTISEGGQHRRIAVGIDVRGGIFFNELRSAIVQLRGGEHSLHTLFLEASDGVLVRRFESVRRPHPLQGDGRVLDGIQAERELLADMRGDADLVVNTSLLNVHELDRRIRTAFADPSQHRLRAILVSFGFKYGLPVDADLVADMRFLPNPFWVPELKDMRGTDRPVAEYVFAQDGAEQFLQSYTALLLLLREGYLREGKQFVTVGIGCTGGKHRSVAMSEELARRLREADVSTLVVHRDLGRE